MSALKTIKLLWNAVPFSDYMRWRLTQILLEPVLPFIKGSVVYTAYLREKEWHAKRLDPFHGAPFPKLPNQDSPDIFFWAVIDWRYRIQRPQHLAKEFAKQGHRVFYISTAFIKDGRAGFALEQMDEAGRIYVIRLYLNHRPQVYLAPPSDEDSRRLRASIAALLQWTNSRGIISIVQHPYWHRLAKTLPDSRLIYDCLDLHEGFGNTGQDIAALETMLLEEADLVATTSQHLYDLAKVHNSNVSLIRNATEYEFFAKSPGSVFQDVQGRQVIGYYGAIADWMDVELLAKVAKRFAHCLLLMVGADEAGARHRLADFPNVLFTGEVPYADLPHYLYGMDVCLLPFQVTPLTLATNPVKLYEYLSAGKPSVAIDLPEMAQFGDLVATTNSHEGFLAKVEEALAQRDDQALAVSRRSFAAKNDWRHRAAAFLAALASLPEPRVSVIVVTYNNLALTRRCLDSLERYSDYGNLEVIVVDNASGDGTPGFLRTWATGASNRTVILNDMNRGFSAANNQGMAIASGKYLVLLNNDTEVTPGWIRTLMAHFSNKESVGMVGPVTNNIGNEARIKLRYCDSEEMRREARAYTLQHMGEVFPIRTLAFFCVMMSRQVYERVGPLDEAFGLGFFEDDDYCRRVEQMGWKLYCAEDVFIHHNLSASFGKLGKKRQELLEANRKVYEAKWGPWQPHRYR